MGVVFALPSAQQLPTRHLNASSATEENGESLQIPTAHAQAVATRPSCSPLRLIFHAYRRAHIRTREKEGLGTGLQGYGPHRIEQVPQYTLEVRQ